MESFLAVNKKPRRIAGTKSPTLVNDSYFYGMKKIIAVVSGGYTSERGMSQKWSSRFNAL